MKYKIQQCFFHWHLSLKTWINTDWIHHLYIDEPQNVLKNKTKINFYNDIAHFSGYKYGHGLEI